MSEDPTSFFTDLPPDLENGLADAGRTGAESNGSSVDSRRAARAQRLQALQRGELPELGTLPSTEGSVDSEFEAAADALLDRQLAGEDVAQLLARHSAALARKDDPLDEDDATLAFKSGFISKRSRHIEVFWTTKRIKETIAISLVSLLVLVFLISLFVKLFQTV